MKFFKLLSVLGITIVFINACKKANNVPVPGPSNTQSGSVVTTFASTIPLFNAPTGIAVDTSGNVYVTYDEGNHLSKISSGGIVITALAQSTSFYYAYGVAIDDSGNVYVADSGDNLIRKITPSGLVITLAGNGQTNAPINGIGAAASFNYPNGVAVDDSGNVYVADTDNQLIRKITSSGVVTTLAGSGSQGSANGTGTAASFKYPYGVAVDTAGNIYVSDTNNNLIRKITPGGVVTTFAGSGRNTSTNGIGTSASFSNPRGIAIDKSGNLYVADTGSNLIRKITSSGVVTTFAGSGSIGSINGIGTVASFNNPFGIAVDKSGNVYVADTDNNLIRKITPYN